MVTPPLIILNNKKDNFFHLMDHTQLAFLLSPSHGKSSPFSLPPTTDVYYLWCSIQGANVRIGGAAQCKGLVHN